MRFPVPPTILAALAGAAALMVAAGSSKGAEPAFLKGADLSALPDIEAHGGVYTDAGEPEDLLAILQDHGVNAVRLRLWHTPPGVACGLARTLAVAERIRGRGMTFLLDLHYSDTWADPGNQGKPAAWAGLPSSALRDSVYRYTFDVMTALRDRNALPDLVQIGNEVTCGMLWDDGRVCGAFDTPEQWDRFAGLVDAGVRGVRESLGPADSVRIVIHIDRGGDPGGTRRFFDNLLARDVDFDVIGLSYYPWWHGTLDDLRATLDSAAARYDKDLLLVETAYPWTLEWHDDTHNLVGLPAQLHDGYPATVEGQGDFLAALLEIVAGTPGGRGRGVFYWAPEHIAVPGSGSPWENLTLFDFRGRALPSLAAFEEAPAVALPAGSLPGSSRRPPAHSARE